MVPTTPISGDKDGGRAYRRGGNQALGTYLVWFALSAFFFNVLMARVFNTFKNISSNLLQESINLCENSIVKSQLSFLESKKI